jgi:hypothetical protein
MKIGQIVQCIDDEFPPKARIAAKARPHFLGRYTVREIVPGCRGEGVRLTEIINTEILVSGKAGLFMMEPTFLSSRFVEVADAVTTANVPATETL